MLGFDKLIPSSITEYELYDVGSGEELTKVANNAIDFPEGFEFDPDYLYMWVRIVSAGEFYGPNKNGDYFPEQELVKFYNTFRDGHAFKNHENKKVENAIGEIIDVRWNPAMKCVEVFKGIDRNRAPEVVRGFSKGYLTDVSMGCRVPYTICSVCGNKARRQSEFCDHIRHHRMDYLGNGERVFEINFEPKFHDSSTVLNGAERVAKAVVIIEKAPEGVATSFKKVAGAKGVTRFIRLSEPEIEKVASIQTIHPMLQMINIEKQASTDQLLLKIAELEKDLTGRLMNIVSAPEENQLESAQQMLQIIKFLTEKRMDEDSLKTIGATLASIAKQENIPAHEAVSTLLGVAELMGIEFFPSELHTILSEVSDAKLNDQLSLSDLEDDDDVYPTDFARGIKKTLMATEQLPDFSDPSSLFELYNEGAHRLDEINADPFGFVADMSNHQDLDGHPNVHVIRIIRHTLEPVMPARSQFPEHLLPRLSVVLTGHKPIIGDGSVRRDLSILSAPKTLGDMLATFAYRNYQRLRPNLLSSRWVKLACYEDAALEKVALFDDELSKMKEQSAFSSGKRQAYEEMARERYRNLSSGIKRRHLAMGAIPLVYGASLFQKNRREHGRNLSDVENFVADHPFVISTGVIAGGKPLSKALIKGGRKVKNTAKQVTDKAKDIFDKSSSIDNYEELVKVADSFSPGNFNAFDERFLNGFAKHSGMEPVEIAALKIATLLSTDGLEKEANEILSYYQIPSHAKEMFLESAAEYVDGELEKAADDFVNTLILDGIMDHRSLTPTIPGRLMDAFVMKKLMASDKPNEKITSGDVPNTMPSKGENQNE